MPPKRVAFEQSDASKQAPKQTPPTRRRVSPANQFAFSYGTAFAVFAAVNTISALLAPIQDCDETFNYWEPTHYLLHGYGRQTWEYSPDYAIRDWVYVGFHAVVAKLSSIFLRPFTIIPASIHDIGHGGKILEFYGLRICLGWLCALCQARFTIAISRTLNPRPAIFAGIIMATSTGFYHASVAFLPSSFAMSMCMLGAGSFMDWTMGIGGRGAILNGSNAGIMWFGAGAILGWPFAAALIIPFLVEEVIVAYIADDILDLLRKWIDGSVRSGVILTLQMAINVFFYHKTVVVPANIVMYNVFGGEGRGPDIFGTEPADYYIKNLLLNFNVWLPLALLSAPLVVLRWLLGSREHSKLTLMRSMFHTAPFYLWLGIFSAQAHKEERFMYPAYPFLALNAAISLHMILSFVGNADPRTLIGKIPAQVKLLVVGLSVLAAVDLSIFRTISMTTSYRAPMTIYSKLQQPGTIAPGDTVCLGKEWYRFPSSFFLPNDSHAKFIRSEFDGLLPGEFSEATTGFGLFPGTWMTPSGMNDRNEFDPGKLMDIRGCQWLVDSYMPGNKGSDLEPNYALSPEWERVQCSDFLDAANTPVLARLLWIPEHAFVPEKFRRKWGSFCLLRRRNTLGKDPAGL